MANVPRADGRKLPARELLLGAATRLFSQYGLRRTSMEAVALEAGVAKATAYAYFSNKEALFSGVCEQFTQALHEDARSAAAQAQEPREAVRASLCAKFSRFHGLVHASLHGQELLDASNTLTGPLIAKAHAAYVEELAGLVRRATGGGRAAAVERATLLDEAAEGLAARAKDTAVLERRLTMLVEGILGNAPSSRAQNL